MYTRGMAQKRTPARYELGNALDGELSDLSAGYRGAPVTGLVRQAVEEFIERCLEQEPAVRKRYEKSRSRPLGKERAGKLSVVKNDES